MNQRGSMNQRTDEIERILNASKVNYSSPQVSQQPTLYEVQRLKKASENRKSKTVSKQKKSKLTGFMISLQSVLPSHP